MTADFRSFQAYRYNAQKIDVQQVIAPPYDVISPAYQEKLYQKSPYNCIRLILNREENGDNPSNNRYTRARGFFQKWQDEQVLSKENAPVFYLYQQTFKDLMSGEVKTRTSLFGRLRLEPFDKGIVIPHEKTLSKPKQDRMNLLKEIKANLSPVFGLYEDPAAEIKSLFEPVLASKSEIDVTDDEGVRHLIWLIEEPSSVEKIQQKLNERKIYIADGHHRYQTALDYALWRRENDPASAGREMAYDFILMALVAFEDQGLSLYPTHRMINTFDAIPSSRGAKFGGQEGVEALQDDFMIEEKSSLEALNQAILSSGDDLVLGLAIDGKYYFLKLKDWTKTKTKMTSGKPDIWYQLDVNLLSHLILAKLWKLPESEWESTISYTHAESDVVEALQKQTIAAAFIMKAPKVQVLRDMGQVNELMPQKSTYFYPKLASGLIFNKHE
ncbi:MAG: DUF1015 domain-containing protein [Candidatus Omnitrophica bacterium]|nr:DUF1015 domain-containing protein [Candidatus Omnitrophota bacterium]